MKVKLFFLLIIHSGLLFSQNIEYLKDLRIGVTLGYGNTVISYDKMNMYLISNNYFPINYNAKINTINSFNIGIEIRDKNNYCRLVVCKDINNLFDHQNNMSYINYTGISLDLFKNMCKNEKWIIAPMIGANLSDFYLTAVSSTSTSVLTKSSLQESLNKKEIYFLKPGVEIRRLIQVSKNALYSIGVNCYYQIELTDGKWKDIYGIKSNAFPASRMSCFVTNINSTIYF